MKHIKIFVLVCIIALSTTFGNTFAATPQSQVQKINRTITINKATYSLNICNPNEVAAVRVKIAISLKDVPLSTRTRTISQVRLLQRLRTKACTQPIIPTTTPTPNQNTTTVQQPISTPTSSFIVIKNPLFLEDIPSSQKTIWLQRSSLYSNAVEWIIDSMIKQSVLTYADKEIMKGKIEITYVNNCKVIDGLTTVKQWYNQNKVLVKNELISIQLNVSVCELPNYWSLFSTSYRHVLIHEIWHYVYYLKDKNTKAFEDICWDWETRKMACVSFETFYSKYAMNDAQEDYAESFAYRFQNKKPEFDISNPNLNLSTLNIKASHFSNLFSN